MIPPYYYRLEVLAGGLGWLTDNQRLLWTQRNQRVQGWRLATGWRARQERLPRIEYARIICELRFTDSRRRDPGNWNPTAKACVDGLVDAGVFTDDDHTRVIGPDMRMGPKVPPAWKGIHLLIYPLEKDHESQSSGVAQLQHLPRPADPASTRRLDLHSRTPGQRYFPSDPPSPGV